MGHFFQDIGNSLWSFLFADPISYLFVLCVSSVELYVVYFLSLRFLV